MDLIAIYSYSDGHCILVSYVIVLACLNNDRRDLYRVPQPAEFYALCL
jgi:hypothetical protein